jgi:pre-rRNA-processing protein TSR3
VNSDHSAIRIPSSALPNHPSPIIVVHPKERRSKCSVEPLRGRPGFAFRTFPDRGQEPLTDYVRLGIGGPLLSAADADRGLLVLDGTWRYAEAMERDHAEIPVRSLPAWQTAYPRKSKVFDDPEIGLATIEAIFAAYVALGRPTTGLLDKYRWANEFLQLNAALAHG